MKVCKFRARGYFVAFNSLVWVEVHGRPDCDWQATAGHDAEFAVYREKAERVIAVERMQFGDVIGFPGAEAWIDDHAKRPDRLGSAEITKSLEGSGGCCPCGHRHVPAVGLRHAVRDYVDNGQAAVCHAVDFCIFGELPNGLSRSIFGDGRKAARPAPVRMNGV